MRQVGKWAIRIGKTEIEMYFIFMESHVAIDAKKVISKNTLKSVTFITFVYMR